jgi:drug/metabolite transporter (DMT)-like permease
MVALAFVLVIVSAVLHALWNFTTKKVSGKLGVIYLGLAFASVFLIPFALIFVVANGLVSLGYLFIIATGIIHTFYFFFLSRAYVHGNISVVYPIARGCGVVGTAAVAFVVLRESISMTETIGIICTSLGIVLIGMRRGSQTGSNKGLLYAMLVGLTMIFYSIVDKMAVAYVDPVVYILGLFFLSMFFLTPYMLIAKKNELAKAWREYKRYSMIIGIGSAAGYLIILFVFRLAQVSYVVAVREVSVALGAILGMTYLGEVRSKGRILGIGLILTGLILRR